MNSCLLNRLTRFALVPGSAVLLGLAMAGSASAFVFDFETDDGGNPLTNGQAICTGPGGCVVGGDTVFEFGNLANVRTTNTGPGMHMGAATFNSTIGTNALDPDLWVDKGNILVLQNNSHPSTTLDGTFGQVFTTPNDEKDWEDAGSIIFDFNTSVFLNSIVLIDINGGVELDIILMDSLGRDRTYSLGERWTQDVSDCGGLGPGCLGYHTLDLTTLLPQAPEPGATGLDATAAEVAGFDPNDVVSLEIAFMSFSGTSPISGGIDDLTGIPEPGSGLMLSLGLAFLARRRSQRTS